MLRNFRQVFKGNQMPMTVVMGLVLVGLVAYLAPSSGNPEAPDNVVARVYGRDILKRDTDQVLTEMVRRMGKQPNLEMMMPYLQAQAVNELMREKLQAELAERHGVMVTDTEVLAALRAQMAQNPNFLLEDGRFRPTQEINQYLLETQGVTLRMVEDSTRQMLLIRKLIDQEAAKVPVDEAWLNQENRVRNEKLAFDVYTLTPDVAAVADPGDAKLGEFLKAGGARFQVGPRRVIQYVSLEPGFFGNNLNVDDAAVQAAYESKKAQYTEMKVSHILFKAATEAEFTAATQRAEALRAKLVAGQDFGKTAQEVSDDPPAKQNKGFYDWFKSGTMAKPFEDGAAALKVGEISQPVRTQFGIHLIRLEGKRTKSFDEAKAELKAQLTEDRFAAMAKERLEQLRKRAGERGDLAAAARNLGLKAQLSQPFLQDAASIEGLGDSAPIVGEAFRMKVGQVSKLAHTGASYVVFRVQEERPSAVPPLAEIRDRVLKAWKTEEARNAALASAKAALASGNLKALGEPKSQDGAIASLGELANHPGLRKALLDTAVGQFTAPLWNGEGQVWIAKVKSRTPAEPLTFEKRQALLKQLQRAQSEKILVSELQDLDAKGRQRSGFSSLWGRFGGIWENPKVKVTGSDMMDVE
ncbi:MAG: peptidyl-prolyl cis-trans isomerase [Firmicutes bacterium]|nr:peptidyl-prolyl cis-trans isomerase [Bacillota bacterium]